MRAWLGDLVGVKRQVGAGVTARLNQSTVRSARVQQHRG